MRKFLLAAVVLAATTLAASGQTAHPRPAKQPPAKMQASAKPIPLTPRERALQFLDRFTFGPRPGDVEQVLALGPDQWFEQQLNPASISDKALDRRLNDYPTLNMAPAQAFATFPDRNTITQVAQGKTSAPTDPLLAAVYEVQVFKYNRELAARIPDATGQLPAEPTDAEKAVQKQQDQAAAARIAGDLFALPKNQRMAELIHMPVPDRIAFTTYLAGPLNAQRNLLFADFTPREREIFNSMASNVGASYQIVNELQQSKIVRAILSERQVQEVMTDFWFNHFNIYIVKDSDQWYTTAYERDAIRAHALGKFRDLLLATAKSPAMMVYLDNWLSIGPDSLANGVNPANPKSKPGNKGLNENYGREVMELHTVGVNGGYTQADVTALSAILTGWGVDNPGKAGPFFFDPKRHEPGPKQWLGHTIASSGMSEGDEALTILASSPQTAHFISFLLAQRFVADDPPPALVDRMATTYLSSDGDIKAVLRTLISSPEFNSRKYFRNKVKTPIEFIASAFRTTATDPTNPGALVNTLRQMGMPLYNAPPPTGYYLTADRWMNSAALVDRLNFAYQLTSNKYANQKFDAAHVLAFGLLSEPPTPMPTMRAHPITDASPATNSGATTALRVLEDTLIGVEASAQTNDLIHKQIDQLPAATPTDTLNLITALILGSPDFQFR